MSTRNIVPRANEEGNIGTAVKNWLKGWFKDLFISGVITDGTNEITIAQLLAFSPDDVHSQSEGESTTTSLTFQQKARLTFTPGHTTDYLIRWTAELGCLTKDKQFEMRVEMDDTTEISLHQMAISVNDLYAVVSGFQKVSLTKDVEYTFDVDYRAVDASTVKIRRVRMEIQRT